MQGLIVGVKGAQGDFVGLTKRDTFHLRDKIKLTELIDQIGGLDVARENRQSISLEHCLIRSPQ